MRELRVSGPTFTQEVIATSANEKAGAAGREQDLSLDAHECGVAMAPSYFKKIVDELADNAFKFSKAATPVRVASGVSNERFQLVISDRGRGMTAQQIADIGAHMQFERRFYEQQGVGLGLIIAKRLVELHGGDFLIESVPGTQTTVQVLLPRAVGAN
jgi:signal transduction histidine kinase